MRISRGGLGLLLVLAVAPAGCALPTRNAKPPETAPIQDAPTLRPTPTPPGRESEVPGPPYAISP
jgi:hypothetical protein